jgi:SAM-dependent methyltransferase
MVGSVGSARRLPPLTVMAWLRFDAIRRAVAAVAPGSVLEVGCGEGALGAWLAARATYTGVEPDTAARAIAAARVADRPGARVVASLDDTVGIAADLACAFEVLEHVEDDVGLLTTVRSRLRPGGALLLSVPAHPERYGASDELVGHHRRYARAELEDRLAAAGYAVTWVESYGTGAGHVLDRLQDALASRRLRASSADDAPDVGTPASGRYRQPTSPAAAAVRAGIAAPFRVVQRPFRTTAAGVGWVALARAVRVDGLATPAPARPTSSS